MEARNDRKPLIIRELMPMYAMPCMKRPAHTSGGARNARGRIGFDSFTPL
jgi:hypothetical protein